MLRICMNAVVWFFFKMPILVVKKIIYLIRLLHWKQWNVMMAMILAVLIFGSITAAADITVFGQVGSIARTGKFTPYTIRGMEDQVHADENSFGYKYATAMRGVLKLPVFTPQIASASIGRAGGWIYYVYRYKMNRGAEVIVIIFTVLLMCVFYFLAYDITFGFVLIIAGFIVDLILHAAKLESVQKDLDRESLKNADTSHLYIYDDNKDKKIW